MRLLFETPWTWALAALAALLPLGWYTYHQRPQLLRWLRLLFVGLLLLLLLKPSLMLIQKTTEKPRLTLLINRSKSMGIKEKLPGSSAQKTLTRWHQALEWLSEKLPDLEKKAQVQFYAWGEYAERQSLSQLRSLSPSETLTSLETALQEVLREEPQQIWILSDGVEESSEDLVPLLDHLPVPLNVLGVGKPEKYSGGKIARIQLPDFTFLHLPFEIHVDWEIKSKKGQRIPLKLFRNKRLLGEQLLSSNTEEEIGHSTFTVYPGSLGRETYRAELDQSFSESSTDVLRQKWRIMHLTGRPSFEYAHLRDLLKSNPNYELVSFVILRNPDNIMPVPDSELSLIPFPAQEIFVQDLFRFDLFILENFAWSKFGLPLSYLESLKTFVSRGGGLLIIGGENALIGGGYKATALEALSPINFQSGGNDFHFNSFKPKPYNQSLQHPLLQWMLPPGGGTKSSSPGRAPGDDFNSLWNHLPPLEGFHSYDSLKPGAIPLWVHPSQKTPLGQETSILTSWSYGKGKVLLWASPSTWKWKLAGGLNPRISSFYARFWTRNIQYLTGDLDFKRVRWSPLPQAWLRKDPLPLSFTVFDETFQPFKDPVHIRVHWFRPGQTSPEIPLVRPEETGRYQVELHNFKKGPQRLKVWVHAQGKLIGEDEIKFEWNDSLSSYEAFNRNALVKIAHKARGNYSDLNQLEIKTWLRELPPSKEGQVVVGKKNLWDSPLFLGLLIGLIFLEWILRRMRGYS
ncbi:MAG: hypothetical protein HY399_01640 [Elusimicrobia bacterium]|nr:hypothetical protein [Elusimicrobiota bacterium]